MTYESSDQLIESLDLLLDSERRALVAGDLDELTRIYERKERLVDALNERDRIEAEELTGLRAKMRRNQDLMNSALEGIRAVADRMTELRRVRQRLATYDRDGKRHEIPTQTAQKLEKRA